MNELRHTYSDSITHKRVLVIGPTPPPLGGVSVHIKRVIEKLTQQHNTVYSINPENLYPFNFLRMIPFKYCAQLWYLIQLCIMIFYYRPNIIMYHAFCMRNSIPELMLLTNLKKIIPYATLLIEHDCRHMYQRSTRWQHRFSHYLARIDQLICIGNITYQSYLNNNISMPLAVTVESAFLPPIMSEEKAIYATYPQELFAFLNAHAPIIVVNAFQFTLWQSKDLYGIDQAIEMIKNLKETHSKIGLVIVLGSLGNEQYYHMLIQRIRTYALHNAIFIMHGQKELWPLLKYATIFVRPTLSDGCSVSIAEALYLGTPTVASDVCKRPTGTVLYKTAHVNDLIKKVRSVLEKKELSSCKIPHQYSPTA